MTALDRVPLFSPITSLAPSATQATASSLMALARTRLPISVARLRIAGLAVGARAPEFDLLEVRDPRNIHDALRRHHASIKQRHEALAAGEQHGTWLSN